MDTTPAPQPIAAEAPIIKNQEPIPPTTGHERKSRRKLIALIFGLLIIFGVVIFLIPLPLPAGSTITLDPADSINVLPKGTTWTTKVAVRTSQPVNAVDTTITFPAADMQVTNIDTSNSDFDVVLFEPKVDNVVGTVRFIQATPEPYAGKNGMVGIITFKVQEETRVKLGVGTANITSADGKATNTYSADSSMTIWQWLMLKVDKK